MDNVSGIYGSFDADAHYRAAGLAIGAGSVGGKARGLAVAQALLDGTELAGSVKLPDLTMVLTTEVFESFIDSSGLGDLYDEGDWERVNAAIDAAPLPSSLMRDLESTIDRFDAMGSPPLAVRSSSRLEDSVSLAFAGKYHTAFAPNCGTREQKLADLTNKVKRVWASTFDPSARAYRSKHGRAHRDEAMAVVIQSVSGREHRGLFYPELAGTLFSRVHRRPSQRIRKEDGLMRLSFGLGTRTVDRCSARTFYLTNPSLRPDGADPQQIATASQEFFDCVDLGRGEFVTVPLSEHLSMVRREHKNFSAYVEFYSDGYLHSSFAEPEGPSRPLFSFPELHVRERALFDTAKGLMRYMEGASGMPMDIEFTYESRPERDFRLVQMRPLASFDDAHRVTLPDVPNDRVLFRGDRMVANGMVEDATHLVYVDPFMYRSDWRPAEVARAIGEINARLADANYILAGPGRWGSRNPMLGVPIMYAEICRTSCLIEISVPELSFSPELSFGTHFFLDMDADGILYLPVFSGHSENRYNTEWLERTPYTVGAHPSVRVYEGRFAAYLDGETERGVVIAR